MTPFFERLHRAVEKTNTPLIVGLDPRPNQYPTEILRRMQDGLSQAEASEYFCRSVIDIAAGKLPACKPQFAFFELLGSPGMQCLQRITQHAQNNGMLVIGDAKRGDIGSTAEAYATAYLDPGSSSGIACDALTINPYMGFDTVEAFRSVAEKSGHGLFVLVKTSNPGSGDLQDLHLGDGQTLFEHVAAKVESVNVQAATNGELGAGALGAVVGATYPEQLSRLRQRMPHTCFLIPGYGAQGGKATDLARGFHTNPAVDDGPAHQPNGAIVNSSRGIIYAWQNPKYTDQVGDDWRAAIELSINDSIEEIDEALKLPNETKE